MKNKNCISCWENMQEYTLLKTLEFDKDVMSFIFVFKIKVAYLNMWAIRLWFNSHKACKV